MTIVCIFFGTILAASAGIGGGGLNAPIFILVTGFIIQEAIPLSHATVMGNSIAQLVINFPQRHPFVDGPGKPLIDYAVPLILLPAQLGGNNLGVLLNPMIPPDILIVFAEMLLAYATLRVFMKGWQLHLAEKAAAEGYATIENESVASHATEASDPYGGLYSPKQDDLHDHHITGDAVEVGVSDEPRLSSEKRALLAEEIKERDAKIPVKYVLLMAVFWVLFAGSYIILKETSKCSALYWATLITMYPVLIGFTWVGKNWIKKEASERESAGLAPIEGNVEWTPKMMIVAPCAAGGVGCVAGLLGLGGGELMAPLLLELGMIPKVCFFFKNFKIV